MRYRFSNGISNIIWFCFLPILFNLFYKWTTPLPLILRIMSQHFFIEVLAFDFDTCSCLTFLLLAQMTCLALALLFRYSCKFAFVRNLLKILSNRQAPMLHWNCIPMQSEDNGCSCNSVSIFCDYNLQSLINPLPF